GDATPLDGHVGLDDAPVVHNEGIGDHRVRDLGREPLALAHAVPDDLAAAELHFLAVDRPVGFHLDPELGVGEAHPVADGRPVHLRIGLPRQSHDASGSVPITRPWKPTTRRSPASRTSVTVRVCPGSKRTAVPAGMSSRHPSAACRSNTSASLVSWKWYCEPTWTGRSPVLATTSVIRSRPALISISPSAVSTCPGIILVSFIRWAGAPSPASCRPERSPRPGSPGSSRERPP